jgi:hypothetical protein
VANQVWEAISNHTARLAEQAGKAVVAVASGRSKVAPFDIPSTLYVLLPRRCFHSRLNLQTLQIS